jgi:anaerobic magnesium-protoporphyrin IX monomethyl ester cyclase
MQIMKKLGVPWFCYARVPPITEEVAQLMGDSGCGRVFLGVESLEQRTLDYLNKATTVEQNVRAINALAGAGVGVVAAHMFGMPHDTVEAMLQNLDRYLGLPILFANNSILSPDPGTTEFHRARQRNDLFRKAFGGESGMRLVPNPEEYGVEIPYGLPSVCRHVGKSDLNRLLFLAEVEFYLRDSQWSLYESRLSGKPMVGVIAYYQFLQTQLSAFDTFMRQGDPLIVSRWNDFLLGFEKTALRRRWHSTTPA